MEDDNLIDAVEKFRAKMGLQDALHLVAGDAALPVEPQFAAQVAGHNHHAVAKIHRAALAVGQAAVIEQLQQHVKNFAVSLFNFVKEDDTVGPAAGGFGELAAFLVTDITRRGADEARNGMFLLVFAHVDADHGMLVVKQKFSQGARQLGFTHTGGAEEDKRSNRAVGVLQPGARTAHRIGDSEDGFVLADDAIMQAFLHVD